MTVINTNVKALYTQSALKVSNRDSQVAMQQLSTGKRINTSKDDAAGLAIAARMTQNIQGLKQAVRNAGDAISMIQTAEGATQEITVMLQRMSELAVQAANSTYSNDQRGYLDQEFQQLKQEIVRISDTHEWNGFPILNGKAGIPVGSPKTETNPRAGVSPTSTGKALLAGDLEIQTSKGSFAVPASLALNDPKSSALATGSNKAASAIAIAAAINARIGDTGVNATANSAVISATKTTVGTTSIQTDLYVNGERVSLSLSAGQTASERRQYVMESINAGTATHGVLAGDGGNGGLTLKTTDGRNLSVWYDSTVVSGTDFGLGMDTATPSNPMGVTGIAGSTAISAGSLESSAITFADLTAGQRVTVNGLSFTSKGATTAAEVATAFSNLKSGMTAIAATASNSASAALGTFSGTFAEGFTTGSASSTAVTATAVGKGNVTDISISVTTAPTVVTTAGTATSKETSVITFNPLAAGEAVTVNGLTYTAKNSLSASQVAAAFASLTSGMTAAAATTANSASAALGTYSGTSFTAGFTTGTASGSSITATSTAANGDVTDIAVTASITAPTAVTTAGISVAASTVYGTVTLTSNEPFTVKPGANAYPQGNAPAADPTYSNFTALGFESQTINPKNIGRLSFQVGPAENQLITIDMADFGPNGDITGPITSLTAPTNLLSMQSANDVIMNVNKSLDRIASTRATMGAVMNRLEHVIDNLTNVVMNSEASRSQIEDADYAQASTELARTQIMQQAATAVLAQANTSQQTVLKLLQG
jgi:flagellin